MTDQPRVSVSVERHVAHVRLDRAEKHNGLDLPMFEALIAAGEQIASDRSVRAVVLSGEGPSFCAGLDWQSFLAMGPENGTKLLARDPARSPANVAQRACWIWAECPVPVICAIHGACYGGGLQLALAADLRITRADAKLSVMEIRYGLIPDMTATRTLLRLVRPDVARELVYTGRTLTGEEAVQLGLATRVDDNPVDAARMIALAIASRSPHAIRSAKRLFEDTPDLDVAGAFALETELQLALLGSPNQMEAVQAVMGKREPAFTDPE